MEEQHNNQNDFENKTNDAGFVQTLAQYYSDFLATDFKKGRLPKRRFQVKDAKGRRSGIALEKFSTFETILKKSLSKDFDSSSEFLIKLGSHKAQLSAVTVKAIEASIKKLSLENLQENNQEIILKFQSNLKKVDVDLESELEEFLNQIRRNTSLEISAPLISLLAPVFQKSSANLNDLLFNIEDEIADIFLAPISETMPSAIALFLQSQDSDQISNELVDIFSEENVRKCLFEYFRELSAGDLFSEVRELIAVEQLEDNLEFYLYFGDIKLEGNSFPIFYMPIKVSLDSGNVEIKLEPRILVNKKAVDYAAILIQEQTKSKRASAITDRIIYLSKDTNICEEIDAVLQNILLAFEFDGSLTFQTPKSSIKGSKVSVSTSLYLALFDKSDESMLTDYEELIHSLQDGNGLIGFLEELVEGFLEKNPANIIERIEDEWDETEVPERLVFATPLPLAEEQRKIISALENSSGKFVTVEGPPGTGKSHTISAIAFGAILKGQSILVLSDKKEALDVVENKLNDTLGKVRPSADFVNPILRLGRTGSNFTKLTTTKSIDNLRTQHREIKKNKDHLEKQYNDIFNGLKEQIRTQIDQSRGVDLSKVIEFEHRLQELCDDYSEVEGLHEFINSVDATSEAVENIKKLTRIISQGAGFPDSFINFSKRFDEEEAFLSEILGFILSVKKFVHSSTIFEILPKLRKDKIHLFQKYVARIRLAKGFFGYLFSGSKISQIKLELQNDFGWSPGSLSPKLLMGRLLALESSAIQFYDEVEKSHHGWEQYIDEAVFVGNTLQVDKSVYDYLVELEEIIDNDGIPYFGDEEKLIDIFTSPDSVEANFYKEVLLCLSEREDLRTEFDFKDYNYLARKTELENYNALELASEIDARVIKFATENRNDAKALSQIIRQKKKFPKDQFSQLKNAFPCMICSLRDYAEYIPLEKELFDIIIIDEASQVSIAQAFPALIRAKKMIVLGDRRQFGNVKTQNASKEQNASYFARVKNALEEEKGTLSPTVEVRAETLNISNSVMDFMESVSNFTIMLKKHFRGYPEMISFSSKYFYGDALQPMKIRGKPISEVLEFVELQSDGQIELYKNVNDREAEFIISRMEKQLDESDYRSVAVITPFTKQQEWVSRRVSDHPLYEEFKSKLKFRSFTFDSCQGEERDIIYYSFVADENQDKLWSIFPVSLNEQSEEELDRNKKMQRLNVGFSRGKEKLVFIHSKPIDAMKSSLKEVLQHYKQRIANAKAQPSYEQLDKNSPAERRLLDWLKATPVVAQHQPEIIPQFGIGDYLKSLDPSYRHPSYRVDFLLRFVINNKQRDIILEYDGFEFHFETSEEIDAGNWRHYLTEGDVERERVLESYGYKTLRVNKFNVGADPVTTLDQRIWSLLEEFMAPSDTLIRGVVDDTNKAYKGLQTGEYRHCKKCDQNKPFADFQDASTKRGYRTYCSDCTKPKSPKRAKSYSSTRRRKSYRRRNFYRFN